MKLIIATGLCMVLLLSGCASTPVNPPTPVEPVVDQPPQAPGQSVSKSDKKPQPDPSASRDDKKPQTRALGMPTVIVAAHYPKKALDLGIEGYVTLEYTVTKTGDLQDIVVIDSSPPGYFEQAALKAASEFRYQPKIVNGEPVDVPRAQYKMLFALKYIRPRG